MLSASGIFGLSRSFLPFRAEEDFCFHFLKKEVFFFLVFLSTFVEHKASSTFVEVAFNNGEAIAWNLLKPVLASELNHVRKDAQTRLGVVIMASEDMKRAGGFDSAVGTFEKAVRYLKPLQNQLTCPMVLIGLSAPESFEVKHVGKPKRAEFVDRQGK